MFGRASVLWCVSDIRHSRHATFGGFQVCVASRRRTKGCVRTCTNFRFLPVTCQVEATALQLPAGTQPCDLAFYKGGQLALALQRAGKPLCVSELHLVATSELVYAPVPSSGGPTALQVTKLRTETRRIAFSSACDPGREIVKADMLFLRWWSTAKAWVCE